jgi:hypothetical protein
LCEVAELIVDAFAAANAYFGAWHKHRYNAILRTCLTGRRDCIACSNDTIRRYTLLLSIPISVGNCLQTRAFTTR